MKRVLIMIVMAVLACTGCFEKNNPFSAPVQIPSITTQPQALSAGVGRTVTFTVVATGNPQPAYQWRKNGTDISDATSASFSLDSVVMADSGDYSVAVSNSEGTVISRAAHLSVAPSLLVISAGISIDYSEGNIGSYSIPDSTASQNQLSIFNDNDIRTFDGAIYILERDGKDNIIRIPGPQISNARVAYDRNIGAAVNIQDIAFAGPAKAYIVQFNSAQLVIFDPSAGTKLNRTVNLSPYCAYAGTDSAATVPYMHQALYYNGKVYVACQRLKAPAGSFLQAADTSMIVIIDATTDAVESAIKLKYKNPQEMSICNGNLYVASLGKYGMLDGGIECIDLSSVTNEGTILDENMLQGDVGSIIVISATKGYAVISTPSYSTEMWAFNPQTKALGLKISGIDSPCTGHFAYDGTYVYVGDRSMTNPGIAVIDPSTDTKSGSTKNVGLPPYSLAYLKID